MENVDLSTEFTQLIGRLKAALGWKWDRFKRETGYNKGLAWLWSRALKASLPKLDDVCRKLNQLPESLPLPMATRERLRATQGNWKPVENDSKDIWRKLAELLKPQDQKPDPYEGTGTQNAIIVPDLPRAGKCVYLPKAPLSWTDRPLAMSELKSLILDARNCCVEQRQLEKITVQGIGGIGKSTLIAKLILDPTILAAFDAVLWISLGQPPPSLKSLDGWLRKKLMAWPFYRREQRSLDAVLNKHRNELLNCVVLQVIDDVWCKDHAEKIRIGNEKCVFLVVTRERQVYNELGGALHPLKKMERAEALELFKERAPKVAEKYPEEVNSLLEVVGMHPLALGTAASCLNVQHSLSQALDLLNAFCDRREIQRLLALPVSVEGVDLTNPFEEPTILHVLKKSTDLLSDRVRCAFCLLGGVEVRPAELNQDVLHRLWQGIPNWLDEETPDTIDELVSHGLIEPVDEEDEKEVPTYTIHAMLWALARALVSPQ